MRQVQLVETTPNTVTAAIDVKGSMVVAVMHDANYEGTTLRPQVAYAGDDGPWFDLYDDANAIIVITTSALAARVHRLDPALWAFAEYLRWVSNVTPATPTVITTVVLAD